MLSREAYLYPSGYEQVAAEGTEGYYLDIKESVKRGYMNAKPSEDGQFTTYTLIPNDGVYLSVKEAQFPVKCYPEANAVFACNLVKANLIETIKLVSKWYLVPFLLLINKQKALDAFNRVSLKAISAQLLVDNALTDFSREFKKFLYTFLTTMGFTDQSSQTFATIFVNLVDYDNAYRLRLEDTFSETSKEKLLNPRKEIARLVKIMKSREVRPGGKGDAIHRKFALVGFLLSLALLIPKVRKAWKKAVVETDIEKLKLDDIDTYWVCMRNDYKFMGLTDEERAEYAKNKGWNYPTPMKKEVVLGQ